MRALRATPRERCFPFARPVGAATSVSKADERLRRAAAHPRRDAPARDASGRGLAGVDVVEGAGKPERDDGVQTVWW